MFGSAVSICVCERQIACWGNSNQRCENSDNYLFVWSLVQQWDDAPAHLHVQYLEWRFTGPELNVQTDTQWASALEKLVLFYLTAVQMWTDGIIVATIWLWDWSPLLKHTELSKKNDEDCKAKRDSVHSLVKQGWKQTKSCMAKCYIHNNSLIHCLYKKLPFIKSQARKLQHEKGDCSENMVELHFVMRRFELGQTKLK